MSFLEGFNHSTRDRRIVLGPLGEYEQQQHFKRNDSAQRDEYDNRPIDPDADGHTLKKYACQHAWCQQGGDDRCFAAQASHLARSAGLCVGSVLVVSTP